MIRQLAIAISFLAIGAVTASAADLPVKAPAYKAPQALYNWTGFYVGLNAGGAWNDTRDDVFPSGCSSLASAAVRSRTTRLGRIRFA
jgi:opacity protein-like surface antigen